MSNTFKELIIKNKIKSPTHRGFKLEVWEKKWNEVKETNTEDEHLFLAGKVFHQAFVELRTLLKDLYKNHCPKTSNRELLKLFVSTINRDRCILFNKIQEDIQGSLFNIYIDENLNILEFGDAIVESKAKAIHFRIDSLNKKEVLKNGTKPYDILDFVLLESKISEIYGSFEYCWQLLVYDNYSFLQKNPKSFSMQSGFSNAEVFFLLSQIRKNRLYSQYDLTINLPNFKHVGQNDLYVCIEGKNKFSVKSISSAQDKIKIENRSFRINEAFIPDHIPKELLHRDIDKGFKLIEVIEVFRYLKLFSYQLVSHYPSKFEFKNKHEFLKFSDTIKRSSLINSIAKSSKLHYSKVKNIIDFLSYDSLPKQELWSHPIIPISGNELILLTTAIVDNQLLRSVEDWLGVLNIDLSKKGDLFEKNIIQKINEYASKNKYLVNYSPAISGKYKVNGSSEEIDFLMKVGQTILVGELKSIVTTDTPISHFNTLNILEHATDQAVRKAEFVKSNIEELCIQLDWLPAQQPEDVEIVSFVLNSNRVYSGFTLNDVPVCDDLIFASYFEDNQVPLVSVRGEGSIEHLAWLEIYDGFDSFQNNIKSYLHTPPQIQESKDDLALKTNSFNPMVDSISEFNIERLVLKEIDFHTKIITKDYSPFKLHKTVNFEAKMKDGIFI